MVKSRASRRKSSQKLFARIWDKVLVLVALVALFLFLPGQNVYMYIAPLPAAAGGSGAVVVPEPADYPVNQTGVYPDQDITASGIVVVDVPSGVTLYQRNSDQLFAPASTTKILTALVSLDIYDLDDTLTVRELVTEGQMMGLVLGEKISVENLLYGLLIHSGNDAAYVLAENYSGGVSGFVSLMNEKATFLHLTSSTFTNPVGYDDSGHRMSPSDLGRLTLVALRNKTIAKMVGIPQITVSDVTFTHFHPLKNVNQLLGKIPGVAGFKTGWTQEAGESLVTLVERDGRTVIIVLLASKDRFGETAKLIDWIFANYTWEKIIEPT